MTAPAPKPLQQPDDNRAWLAETLPKAAHKKIDAILEHFAVGAAAAVEIVGARVAVERLEVYGLFIALDAMGRAVYIEFPTGGAEVTEWAS